MNMFNFFVDLLDLLASNIFGDKHPFLVVNGHVSYQLLQKGKGDAANVFT